MPGWPPPPMPTPPKSLACPLLGPTSASHPINSSNPVAWTQGEWHSISQLRKGSGPPATSIFRTELIVSGASCLWSFVAGWVKKNTSVLIRSHVLIQSFQLSALHASKDLGFQRRDPLAEVTQKRAKQCERRWTKHVNKVPAFSKKHAGDKGEQETTVRVLKTTLTSETLICFFLGGGWGMGMFLIQGSFSTKFQHDLFYHYIVSCLGSCCWCLEGHGFFRDSVFFFRTRNTSSIRQWS